MRFRDLKKQKNIQKKEQIEINYATYTDRIKAFITDMFMIYAPILYIITYVFLDGKDEFQASQLAPFIGVSMYGIIYALLVSKLAQTPGKKAYIIKIVDAKTHKNISFLRALWRFVAFLFTATTLLGLFLPFYTKDKKALHDILASTVVVTQ
jgi:uncharacterized RDD family membrane protein YckC